MSDLIGDLGPPLKNRVKHQSNLSNHIFIELQHVLHRSECQFHVKLCEFRLPISSKIFISETPATKERKTLKEKKNHGFKMEHQNYNSKQYGLEYIFCYI